MQHMVADQGIQDQGQYGEGLRPALMWIPDGINGSARSAHAEGASLRRSGESSGGYRASGGRLQGCPRGAVRAALGDLQPVRNRRAPAPGCRVGRTTGGRGVRQW